MYNKPLEEIVLGRENSFFQQDMNGAQASLEEAIGSKRILVIGAAGSIGGAFVKVLSQYSPKALWLVDPSENNLVEVVRDLHSSGCKLPSSFGTVAIGFGTPEFQAFLSAHSDFDCVLNFAALKHVRSERDPFSLMRLIEVNILANQQLLNQCEKAGVEKVFAVSSDKAVNPSSLMGASKAFMERLFLSRAAEVPFGSARFANVAFSDGSLLHGFLRRIEKRQPLSGPSDIRRFFINHQEAGELCLLSCFAGKNREIFVPKMEPEEYLMYFPEIAERVLHYFGHQAVFCDSEQEALERSQYLGEGGQEWPCYFSPANTSGEKPFEEFVGEGEQVDDARYEAVRVIAEPTGADINAVNQACDRFAALRASGEWSKEELVEITQAVVPELNHKEVGANLDQKM